MVLHYHIYTDGSKDPDAGLAGAGIIEYDKNGVIIQETQITNTLLFIHVK
jgi:ribonuclease HI